MINPLLAAFQFLTIVPVHRTFGERDIARSLLYFPLVGLAIGAALCMIAVSTITTPIPGAALILLVWVIATGGLHLDGLADSADAWAAGRGDPERALSVMKDSRCGPIAVVAIALILIAKFAALTALLDAGLHLALLAAPMLGRSAVLALFVATPYLRQQGLGSPYTSHFNRNATLCALGITAILSLLLIGVWPLLITVGVFAALRWLMMREIGGMTGDTLGATIEIVEAVAVVSSALALS